MIRRLSALLEPGDRARLHRVLWGTALASVLQGAAFALLVPVLRELLGDRPERAWPWLALLAAVTLAYAAVSYPAVVAARNTGYALSHALHDRIGDRLVRLPLGWFTGSRVGSVGRLVTHDVMNVMSVPAHLLEPLVKALVTPAAMVLVMCAVDLRLGLAALACVPVIVLAYRVTGRLVQRAEHAADTAAAEAGARVVEFAQEQPVLRAHGRTVEGVRELDDALDAQRRAGRRMLRVALPGLTGFTLVVQASFSLLLMLGTLLAVDGTVDAPAVLALLVLAARSAEPLSSAAELGAALRMAGNSVLRIQQVLDTEPLPEPAAPGTVRDASVEVDRVSFGYGDGPVLHEVSLRVPAGTTTALVGPSGSGKTTVTRLIARFFDVHDGAVRVGGTDVRHLPQRQLMEQLALVFQDVHLFDGTLKDNVRLGRPDASEAELLAAARGARVDEIAARLPGGWDTPVGEGGAQLSGGERQRVSVARALLKDAPIVLLDEATAALDAENEAAVVDAVEALTADRTVLVIAHRLETVQRADRVVVLDGGRVVEEGRHAELLARGGAYAALWSERDRTRGWRTLVP
ncbi:ABC transporter ATP-binding protein [Streptomyces sp. ACA25]|uniref:ABC transporter ATP-binding protein n=1 Tax=Streptomyces sp. ACA25 TaxID=3022596 RepID=UPI00230787F5|nr:ABC transporter ATP-binding protein [Streptomyces sp. ACA25]MDB1087485.1 ABC transporter ATP-binding protein [Streptomyces sp. ACA25]